MPASATPTKSSGLRIWVGLVEERWTGFGPAISRPSGPNQGLGPLGSFTDCCPWPRLRPPDHERSFNILKIKWTTLKNLHKKESIIFRHMDLLLSNLLSSLFWFGCETFGLCPMYMPSSSGNLATVWPSSSFSNRSTFSEEGVKNKLSLHSEGSGPRNSVNWRS